MVIKKNSVKNFSVDKKKEVKKKPSAKILKKSVKIFSVDKKKEVKKKPSAKILKKSVVKNGKDMRVASGVPNYDRLVCGGFEKNSTNLLVGGSGSGKSIFATQFLVGGMKKGENCLYVTFEEHKEQFYENMKGFGWDLESYEKKGLFTFLEYSPIKVKTMLEEGGGEIERVILGKKVTRIVIDSITSFALLFKDELEKREAALSLFSMIREWDATALLTLEEDPSLCIVRSAPKTLEFEVDSLTFLYFIRYEGKRQRFLEVVKMRGTKHSKMVYPFEISNGGVSLKTTPVSDMVEKG